MTSARRVGAETSKTRTVLLDCTERVMLENGYAAVTYRAVAAGAGVTSGLVQYYFPTLDDLFIAVVRRRTRQSLEWMTDALRTDEPLRVLWRFSSDKRAAALTAEFMALANHRKKIRKEIGETGERIRGLVLDAMSSAARDYRLPQAAVSPEVLVFLMTSVPRMIVMEEAAGMSTSHATTTEVIERFLDQVEPPTVP
jgi:AcrR family transcriptional regulator